VHEKLIERKIAVGRNHRNVGTLKKNSMAVFIKSQGVRPVRKAEKQG
jgi:hypothetical protein